MITRNGLALVKSSAQVQTAITATAATGLHSTNSDVAAALGLKRWVVVALRQFYNLRRNSTT